MKIKKDTLYTIINDDFEKLRIFPESGYTVWERSEGHDWWCAIPTNYIMNDLEKFVVESDNKDEVTFDAEGLTDFLSQNLDDDKYSDIAIIHDESSDPYVAYCVDKDEVGEDSGHRKAGYHLHLRGEDEDIVTSEEVNCYYLGGTEEYSEGAMYFRNGFSKPPISINDFFVDFD